MRIAELLPPAVAFDAAAGTLNIIDQTLLPGQLKILRLTQVEQVREAICTLQVRGAPAIGIAAAYGLYLALRGSRARDKAAFLAELRAEAALLAATRPTAVNLCWALDRLARAAELCPQAQVEALLKALLAEAQALEAADAASCRAIGEYGLSLLKAGDGVLTHCNAGHLATAGYGTALAPLYLALERGLPLKIFCDETRPLLQGARLTTFELQQAGADATLLCDNMAASLLAAGRIQAMLVGADRIAANGDVANKTGTLSLAVLGHYYGVPLYVCAPLSTIDPACPGAAEMVIEQRPAAEVTELWYRQRVAPPGIAVYNPAFDITPAHLVSAIVTEQGIYRPPYSFGPLDFGNI